MGNKIKIGVSSCLVGERVRWNGEHKQDRYVREVLGKYFEYVPICPEIEVGMGVPRETVALYGTLDKPRMISKKTQTDWTQRMNHFVKGRIHQLARDDLCGYIFKSKSPSCGLSRVPVYAGVGSNKARHGPGLFARAFNQAFPRIPTEDEGRLNDPGIRENFIVRVFCLDRFQRLLRKECSVGKLVTFHAQHKFLLLAHSKKHYDALGQLVGKPKSLKPERLRARYGNLLMEALSYRSTPKKNTDVLLHMLGFLKKFLTKTEKQDVLAAIEDYRKELLPLIVPVTLIRHLVNKHNIEYLQGQVYLNPHPSELMLRNHI